MKYFFEERSVAITEYISGDLDFGAHLHGEVEIGFAAEGSSRLCIEDRSYEIKAGDMFMVFPNMIHRYEHSEAIKAYVVIFSAALLPEALLSAWIFTAKKYVLSEVSVKPTNQPLTFCPSTCPVPVLP